MILPFKFAPNAKRATYLPAHEFFVERGVVDSAILESYSTFGWFPVCRVMHVTPQILREIRCEISDAHAKIKIEGVAALISDQMEGLLIETTMEAGFRVRIKSDPCEVDWFCGLARSPLAEEAKGLVTPSCSVAEEFTFSAPNYPGVVETIPTSSREAEIRVVYVPGAPARNVESATGHGPNGIFLHELLDHPELFEAAPFLRDVPVFFSMRLDACGRASRKRGITLGAESLRYPNFFKDTLLHEVQHIIQFNANGCPYSLGARLPGVQSMRPQSDQAACDRKVFKRRLQKMLSDRNTRSLVRQYDRLRRRVMESAGGYGSDGKVSSPPDISAILALARFEQDHPRVNWYVLRMLRSMASGDLNFKIEGRAESKIKRFAALIEVEARVTERRQYLTDEEMIAQSPWDTMDLLSFPVSS